MSRHLDLETISALLDGELEASIADGAQAHVVECQDCRGRLEGLRVTIGELQKLPPAVPPPHVREALRRQLAIEQEVRRRLWTLPGWHSRLAAWPAMAAAVFLAFGCGLFLYAYMLRQGADRQAASPAAATSAEDWRATITFDPPSEQPTAETGASAAAPVVPPAPAAPAPQAAADRLAKREAAAPPPPPAMEAQAEAPPADTAATGGRGEAELRDATVGSEVAAEPMSAPAPGPAAAVAAQSETRNRELSRRDSAASTASPAGALAEQKKVADEEVLTLGPGIERPVKLSGANPDLQSFRGREAPPPLIIIETTIGSDGRLGELKFRPDDLDPRIAERVRQSLATWRFQPARKDGRAVAVRYTLTLNIHLQ